MDYTFKKRNYVLMLIGLGLIVLGFLLMSGGASEDPTKFSQDIFSFRRITLATIIVMLGFIVEVFAIMSIDKKDKKK
tara:strand:+ start:56 stop:286 length:231 start_codon:yes stop_codon:yes gene_type:complete